MLTIGSNLVRVPYTIASGGVIEYEKTQDDEYAWFWDWSNELLPLFYDVSPEVAFVKSYDVSALAYRDLSKNAWGSFVQMAAFPSTTQDNNACYFGNVLWPSESIISIETPSTAGVYAGDAVTWEYYTGSAWAALTILSDSTDTTGTGKRPFSTSGEIKFNRPTDMASISAGGKTAEWIRARVSTVGNLTTVAIFSYDECQELVSSISYEESGATLSEETVESNVSYELVSGVGSFDATMTSTLGRKVKKTYRFVDPSGCNVDDY